jgi:hypothetical protein
LYPNPNDAYVSPILDIKQLGYYFTSNPSESEYISDEINPDVASNDFRLYFNSKSEISEVQYRTDDKVDHYINITPTDPNPNPNALINNKITFIKVLPNSMPEIIARAYCSGIVGMKLYIEDITSITNLSSTVIVNHDLPDVEYILTPEVDELYPKGFVLLQDDELYVVHTPFSYMVHNDLSKNAHKLNMTYSVIEPSDQYIHTEEIDWIDCKISNVRGDEYEYYPSRISKKGYNTLQIKLKLNDNMSCSKLRVITLI